MTMEAYPPPPGTPASGGQKDALKAKLKARAQEA